MLMSNAAELSVPLVVDIGVGGNWDESETSTLSYTSM